MTTTPPPAAAGDDDLPVLAEARVDAIEEQVFARIDDEREKAHARGSRRTGFWMAGTAAAAVIAVAAIIAPSVVGSLTPVSESGALVDATTSEVKISSDGGAAPESAIDPAAGGAAGDAALGSDAAVSSTDSSGREIIASGWASLLVDDVRAAADQVAQAATARGGYVESLSLGSGQVSGMPIDVLPDTAESTAAPAQSGWITVRVPAEDLPEVIAELDQIGSVTASTVDRYDVTDQVVDLQARIDAAQTSVDRLLALVAQAESVGDLIAAESALAERQATLESYQQQLESLEDQVAMSSLNVTLEVRHDAVDANPAGFWDGLVAGWNGLVATLNGVVVALGFLIPWIVVVAAVGGIVWGIVVLVRRGRRGGSSES